MDHITLCIAIGLPIFSIWIFGFPTYIFYQLRKHSKDLKDKKVIELYGLFYIGLKDVAYYWDIVVSNLRKASFITIVTFLHQTSTDAIVRKNLNYI